MRASFVFFDHGGTLSKIANDTPEIARQVLAEHGGFFSHDAISGAYDASDRWWHVNQNKLPRGERGPLLVEYHRKMLKELGVTKKATGIAEQIEREFYSRAGPSLYSDALPCLEELKRRNIPMRIITQNIDTTEEFKSHALGINGIGHYFSVVVTSGSAGFDKPDPRLYSLAAKLTRFKPAEIVHVCRRCGSTGPVREGVTKQRSRRCRNFQVSSTRKFHRKGSPRAQLY